ncbi:MAG: DUF2062 domain-containing protein [Bacteroidota bacterium]
MDRNEYNSKFNQLKCCVVVPTYNNCCTLEQVIAGVSAFTGNIIVVNDGSTDATMDILKKSEGIEIISYKRNRGKGFALKTGFKKAVKKGYTYAITIDSDGQHNPEELCLFIDRVEKEPDSFVVGVRNLNLKNIPEKSKIANRFSNFWFYFFTDCKLSDTQTGYRLYPLNRIEKMLFFSGKYEFEYEVLVKMAWKKTRIISVPINVDYPVPEKRITHFRPFRDFARITLLNILFFFVTVFLVKPLKYLRSINRKSVREFIKNNILASKDSNTKIVLSVMFGVFMGIVPIWGYQLITAIALAYVFRLNKAIVIVAANISIAPILPLVLYISYLMGGLVLGCGVSNIGTVSTITFDFVKSNFIQYIAGSIIFAVTLALVSGLLMFLILHFFRKSGR